MIMMLLLTLTFIKSTLVRSSLSAFYVLINPCSNHDIGTGINLILLMKRLRQGGKVTCQDHIKS